MSDFWFGVVDWDSFGVDCDVGLEVTREVFCDSGCVGYCAGVLLDQLCGECVYEEGMVRS